MRKVTIALLLLLSTSACALLSSEPEEEPFRVADLEAFTERVRDHVAMHEWQDLLAAADPEHYRVQVVEMGMEEPQYIAELLGLHSVDNNIQEGDTLSWQDLERIEEVSLAPDADVDDMTRLIGTVTLESGETLQLHAYVREFRGRYVLTGGVG